MAIWPCPHTPGGLGGKKKFGWLALEVDGGRCASRRSRAGGGGCCGCERVGVRRCPGLGCAVVPRVRGAVQTEFFSSVASLKNCTRSASLKSGLRTRNTHRGRRPPEDEPKGQGARRARPPLVGCICGLADSTSSASALRCCRCCRVARRGTVCPAPLPLGTACPIPCSSPHCTPVRVSCAPLPAKARVGPACSALPPLLKAFHGHLAMPIYTGWVGWEKSLVGWRSMSTVGVARQVGLEPVVVVVVVMSV